MQSQRWPNTKQNQKKKQTYFGNEEHIYGNKIKALDMNNWGVNTEKTRSASETDLHLPSQILCHGQVNDLF